MANTQIHALAPKSMRQSCEKASSCEDSPMSVTWDPAPTTGHSSTPIDPAPKNGTATRQAAVSQIDPEFLRALTEAVDGD
ncbi:hypothetical protein C3L57_08575, partial [Veillonellaceae bacterium M2-8]|nr:hypothetical protein [Veillonellaceae bacterium M2-8]